MNLKKILALALAATVLFTGCENRREETKQALENQKMENRHEATSFAMDTIMTFTVIHEDGDQIIIDAEQRIRELENLLSITLENSEVSRLNAAAGKEAIEVSKDTWILLEAGKNLGAGTGGAFDIAISPVVKAWGFTEAEHHVPTQAELDALLPLTNPDDVVLDKMTVYLEKEGMAVDLGGIAKGYASDEVASLLKGKGVESAIVSLGGNVFGIGTKPNGEKWEVALANPLDANDYCGLISIEDKAVVTSGGYQRFFEENGKKYHHIIDPATGYPAENGLLSVTIISESGMEADVLSTALFVMGLEDGLKYWQENGGFEAIFVTETGEVIATEGADACFTFEGRDNDFTYRMVERG
ncbi:MAG: FAD:protein FMN transferase [Anaerotignum sp.]|nr:FAD:protein FMN transferase [Anaerotignum sp.]MBR5793863.1 FAD:protein FMN transferase [Anaerotignum sp.]